MSSPTRSGADGEKIHNISSSRRTAEVGKHTHFELGLHLAVHYRTQVIVGTITLPVVCPVMMRNYLHNYDLRQDCSNLNLYVIKRRRDRGWSAFIVLASTFTIVSAQTLSVLHIWRNTLQHVAWLVFWNVIIWHNAHQTFWVRQINDLSFCRKNMHCYPSTQDLCIVVFCRWCSQFPIFTKKITISDHNFLLIMIFISYFSFWISSTSL